MDYKVALLSCKGYSVYGFGHPATGCCLFVQTPLRKRWRLLFVEEKGMGDSYRILAYYGTTNLGDAIQSIAMSRFLPETVHGVYRQNMCRANYKTPFIVNGYLNEPNNPADAKYQIFAGVYVAYNRENHAACMKQSVCPIGARDPATFSWLELQSINSQILLCPTLTFPKYTGPRSGKIAVDVPAPHKSFTSVSNYISAEMSWRDQWGLAQHRLEQLKKAEIVHTNRLHVVLPCLAFGTPVIFKKEHLGVTIKQDRFTLLEQIGFPYDEEFSLNTDVFVENFHSFLTHALNKPIDIHDPVFPVPLP